MPLFLLNPAHYKFWLPRFWFFHHFGCVIFFTLNFGFASLALTSKKSKQTITQYFGNFVAKNNQKPSYQNVMKSSLINRLPNFWILKKSHLYWRLPNLFSAYVCASPTQSVTLKVPGYMPLLSFEPHFLPIVKVIYPKYSKHWLSTVVHTINLKIQDYNLDF